MAALPAAKAAAVAQMIEQSPDAVLARLAAAVSLMPGEQASEMAVMIALESEDRARRAVAFGPVAALFVPRTDGVAAPTYPRHVMTRLWKLVSLPEAGMVARLTDVETEDADADRMGDQLLKAAARRLRETPDEAWPDGEPDQVERLARLFLMGPLMRRARPRLQAWTARPDDEEIAEVRVLFKDAAALAPDGTERFLELVFAHISDASLLLRILVLSAGAAQHSEVLSQSELAVFVDDLLDAADRRLTELEGFGARPDRTQVLAQVDNALWVADLLREMRLTLRIDPDGRWGKTTHAFRTRLERQARGWLRHGEKAMMTAYPIVKQRVFGRMTRPMAEIDTSPDLPAAERALVLLGMAERCRRALAEVGCEAQRNAVFETVGDHVADFADLALDQRADEPENAENALALLRRAAEVLNAMGNRDVGRAIRRRADAAEVRDAA